MAAAKQAARVVLGTMEFGRGPMLEESTAMLGLFLTKGFNEIDTAYMYCDGKTEELLGKVPAVAEKKFVIATKVNAFGPGGNLRPERVVEQFTTSLARMKLDSVDILYLHAPDHNTPLEVTLEAVDKLHKEGKFKRLALSNYASWQVVQAYYICKEHGWVLPTIYQGMYNAITRDVERELFPALRTLGIAFYAYNPLAGGLLTGRYKYSDLQTKPRGRFFGIGWDKIYRDRFWKECNFEGLDLISAALKAEYGDTVTLTAAVLRWLVHHSGLDGARGDAVILGASKMVHLEANLDACTQGPLAPAVVAAIDKAWELAAPTCPRYFR
eukprot:m.21628 g.21628  ORF g.21628 m.21628 type:complete len:326 (-) comp8117_c0_seq2:42-1019(-)